MEQSFEEQADPAIPPDSIPQNPGEPDPAHDVARTVALASEFLHDDYAYEAELNWDVWVPDEGGMLDQWQRQPQPVSIACLGPGFESDETEEHSHLLINFGRDHVLIPPQEDPELLHEALQGIAGNCYQENIGQLLSYIRLLEAKLPVERRLLWSSSGEDLAANIRAAFGV
jgi:hypothetical protein